MMRQKVNQQMNKYFKYKNRLLQVAYFLFGIAITLKILYNKNVIYIWGCNGFDIIPEA